MEVRHQFEADEVLAWWAYFTRWEDLADDRKKDADHARTMDSFARALMRQN